MARQKAKRRDNVLLPGALEGRCLQGQCAGRTLTKCFTSQIGIVKKGLNFWPRLICAVIGAEPE
jgi:hypothetical protein